MTSKTTFTVALLIVSTTASKDPSTDSSSTLLRSFFANENESNPGSKWAWSGDIETKIVGDDQAAIEAAVIEWADKKKINLIVTTGGTGFSVTDCTPEVSLSSERGKGLGALLSRLQAVRPLLDKEAPGLVYDTPFSSFVTDS